MTPTTGDVTGMLEVGNAQRVNQMTHTSMIEQLALCDGHQAVFVLDLE